MSNNNGFAPDYIPVNERIAAFYAKHPDGSLQAEIFELSETRVVMRAYAYRTPTDEKPGIGYSSLEIPGRTPYTRGSEVENCETSAWGRAIAALGFEVRKGIATAEDIANKVEPKGASQARPRSVAAAAPPPVAAAPDELSDDELAEIFADPTDRPVITPHDAIQRHPQADVRLTFSELAGLAEKAGLPKNDIYKTADKMFGKDTKVTALSGEDRAAIADELGLLASA